MLEIMFAPFIVKAVIAALLAAIVSAVIGSFTVLRGLSTMGASIAHASLAGALLAFAMKYEPLLGALALSMLFALITAYSSEHGGVRMDIVLGVSFGFSSALAALSLSLTREYTTTAYTYLIGEVLGVTDSDIILLSSYSLAVIIGVVLFYKEFKFITFDMEAAQAMGLNTSFYNYLMIMLIALTCVVELKIVGSILAVVFIVAPAASAYEFSHDMERMIGLSMLFAVASVLLGMLLSIVFNLPSSPTMGLVASAIYMVSIVLSTKRRICACRIPVIRTIREKTMR